MFDHAVEERFIKTDNRQIVLSHTQAPQLVEMMKSWKPIHVEKWLDRSTR
jgi:hypothetical protein